MDSVGKGRVIGHMHGYVITFLDVDERPRYLSIEGEYLIGKTWRYLDRNFVDGQTEFALRSPSQGRQQHEKEEENHFVNLCSEDIHIKPLSFDIKEALNT
jgi:uncharacterized protein YifE (UPF0438 family)